MKTNSQIESLDPCSPEEVILTVQLPLSGKTLFGQSALAVAALDALDVPRPVQNFEQKPVDDRLLAAGTVEHRVPENIPKPVCGMDARKGLRSGPSLPPHPSLPASPPPQLARSREIQRATARIRRVASASLAFRVNNPHVGARRRALGNCCIPQRTSWTADMRAPPPPSNRMIQSARIRIIQRVFNKI